MLGIIFHLFTTFFLNKHGWKRFVPFSFSFSWRSFTLWDCEISSFFIFLRYPFPFFLKTLSTSLLSFSPFFPISECSELQGLILPSILFSHVLYFQIKIWPNGSSLHVSHHQLPFRFLFLQHIDLFHIFL